MRAGNTLADNNEIFVTQSGSDNFVGDANNPVEQIGTSNMMDITQSGNGNTATVVQGGGVL